MALRLHRQIKPFTTNRALSALSQGFFTHDGTLTPTLGAPSREFGGGRAGSGINILLEKAALYYVVPPINRTCSIDK